MKKARGMASHELLRLVFKKHCIKNIAPEVGRKPVTVYKWTESRGVNGSGLKNPLDEVALLLQITGDRRLVDWVCAQAGGTFVPNPEPRATARTLVCAENAMLHAQGEFETFVSAAAGKGRIASPEAAVIRSHWEQAMSVTEGFVRACERGVFRLWPVLWSFGWWLAMGDAPVPA